MATRYSKVAHHHFHMKLGEWAESSEEERENNPGTDSMVEVQASIEAIKEC